MLVCGVAAEGLSPEASLGGSAENDGSNPSGDEHEVPHIVVVAFCGDGGEEVVGTENPLQVLPRTMG